MTQQDTTMPFGGSQCETGVKRWAAVTLSLLDGATVAATAQEHGVSTVRVRQMVFGALQKAAKRTLARDWGPSTTITEARQKPEIRVAVLALLNEPDQPKGRQK